MENKTKYDIIIEILFDYWIVSILAIIAITIGFIPSLRDGIVQLWSWLKFKKKHKEFKIISGGEMITFETKANSALFDIVKVKCLTHHLGVKAEYQWIDNFYPGYKSFQQSFNPIKIDEDQTHYYDIVEIRNAKGQEKSIYFDISSFFNENGNTSFNQNEFIESKIRELHKSK
jgi:hypothetical protein